MPFRRGGGPQRRLRAALLRWYDEHGRDLPWRRSRDAYRIWVSEVMLQQTRVEVALPAYRRFLRAFPSLAKLARASEEEVLAQWSGLGYYSRARALHRAARRLHDRRQAFPQRLEDALELPGVGAYTAAAVLSIAYGEAYAAVDGNIVRVLSRLRRLPRADSRGEPYRSLAQALLDPARPGDWNQAMMELGQTVCLPRNPRCGDCALGPWCEARRHGEVALFPPPKARRAVERIALELTMVHDDRGRLLLERGAFPHLDHMWLPIVGRALPGPPRSPQQRRTRRGGDAPPHIFRHTILHRAFDVTVAMHAASGAEIRRLLRGAGNGERRLFTPAEIRAIGRSSLLTKALACRPPASVTAPRS